LAAARIIAPVPLGIAAARGDLVAAGPARTMPTSWLLALLTVFPALISPGAAQTSMAPALAPNAVLQENQRAQERMERATAPPRLKGPAVVHHGNSPPVRLPRPQSRRRRTQDRE
jgi:hypothetical protein